MASAASAPSRASMRARMPSPSSSAGVELERRHLLGARAPALQASRRPRRSARLRRRRAISSCHSEPLPLGRQGQQVVVVEADQRRLEDRGQRQVVLRQHQDVAERHQVLHGDLLGQHQPVGAGHLDAARLQGRDHGGGERRALAHQDQDVAGADRPVLRLPASRRSRASRRWCAAMRAASRTAGGGVRALLAAATRARQRSGAARASRSARSRPARRAPRGARRARSARRRCRHARRALRRRRRSGRPRPAAARPRGTTG